LKQRKKIITPIGVVQATDRDLAERLKKLPKNASISKVFREISRWEKEAVIRFQEKEKTKKSGEIHFRCCGILQSI